MIAEHDHRLELGADDEASADAVEGSTEYALFLFSIWTSLNLLPFVMKGGVHLPLVQKTGSLVPVNQENLRFGSRQP